MQDVGGDENWHLYAQPLAGGEARDLTPYEGVRAQGIYTDKHHPEQARALEIRSSGSGMQAFMSLDTRAPLCWQCTIC